MKRLFGVLVLFFAIVCFSSCGGGSNASKAAQHPYAGTFTIGNGISFELKSDSTAVIHFDDVVYDSSWKIVKENDVEFVNIEFNGDQSYYYLKDGKLYRSRMEMDRDRLGSEVTYQD